MSCERYADAIVEHSLGEPAPPELEAHLRSCDSCRETLQRQRPLIGRIDGELREALSVAPSPEFLPRVRERVASRAAAPRWSLAWLVPVAAGAAALAIAAWLLQTASRPQSNPIARVEPRRESPAPAAAEAPRRPETAAVATAPKARAAKRAAEPEVLVSPGEEAALLRFVAGLQTGRVDATALAAGGSRPAELQDLTIAPLEVKPLTSGTDFEGVDHE